MTSSRAGDPSGRYLTLFGAITVATIVGCGLSLTIALIAVRLERAGYSAHAIGLNTAAGGVATLLCAPFIPVAARWIGVARLLLCSLVVGGLALVTFTLTSSYVVWMALRFLVGISVTVEFVLSEFWITSLAPEGRQGLAISLYAACLAMGLGCGPLALTLTGSTGDRPFLVAAALFFAATVPLGLNAHSTPRLETRSQKSLVTFLRQMPAASLAALLHGAIEVAAIGLLPVYALRAGLSVTQGASFASLFILGGLILQVPLGLAADRFNRRILLIGMAGVGTIGALALGLLGTAHLFLFETLLLIWGGIVGAFYPVGLGQLGATYRDADLASANSAFVMIYAMGMLAGPPIIGAGFDLAPPAGFFWTVAALTGLFLLLVSGRLIRRISARSIFAKRTPRVHDPC